MMPCEIAFTIVEFTSQVTGIANVYQHVSFPFAILSTLTLCQSPEFLPGYRHAMEDCYIFTSPKRGLIE